MAKRFKNGLVLGKFMPFHMGHMHLIDVAASQCEKLYVIVCSDETQPIDGSTRFKWVRETYASSKTVSVCWCQDKNPQYPNECESVDVFYNKYWVPSVYKIVKELDVVFTSESYGDEFAQYLGVKHVCVDEARKYIPVSGTQIRNNPLENWKYIPYYVRAYYVKRVVLMGPESVGKSMLVNRLAMHYETCFTPEYGREYTERISNSRELMQGDFDTIARTHSYYVEMGTRSANKVHFVDTEAITTKVFGEMFLGPAFDPKYCDIFIQEQTYHLYLLLDVDVPWVDDGTRLFPEGRQEHFNRLKQELDERKLPYVIIGGDYQERFEKAVKAVDKLLYL